LRPSWKKRFADQPAQRLYLSYEVCHAAAFGTILPLFAIYFRHAQLSLFEIALLAFVFEGTILIWEVPTGTAADLLGRVNALRAASATLLAAGILFTAGRSLGWFVIAEVLCGIGEACRSGSADAWISSILDREGRAAEAAPVFARRLKLTFAASFCGMLAGGLVAGLLMAAGWVLFSVMSLAALLISLQMTEPETARPGPAAGMLRRFGRHTVEGMRFVRSSPRLAAILLLVLTANFAYEGLDQFWQVFLKEDRDVAVVLFGVLTAATALILLLTADRVVPWFYRRLGVARPVYLLGAVAAACLALFATAPWPTVIIASFLLFSVARGWQEPLLVTYMTEQSPPSHRALILSTRNLFSSSGEMVAALTAGLLAAAVGLPTLFLLGAILIVGGVLLFARLFTSRQESERRPSNL
jgi:MFS family permease